MLFFHTFVCFVVIIRLYGLLFDLFYVYRILLSAFITIISTIISSVNRDSNMICTLNRNADELIINMHEYDSLPLLIHCSFS